jgi:hypothetical protein
MNDIDRIVEFIAGFDPGFPSATAGAGPAEIDHLERVVGRPLPEVYKQFLRRMGHGMDWVELPDADFEVVTVTEYYERPPWLPPPEYLLIGWAMSDPDFHVFLESTGPGGPRVVTFPFVEGDFEEEIRQVWWRPVAGSLVEMLGTRAFRTCRMDLLPATALYAGEADLAAARGVFEEMGFRALWFSNDWTLVCDRADAALVATRPEGWSLAINVACQDREALQRIGVALSQRLGLHWSGE